MPKPQTTIKLNTALFISVIFSISAFSQLPYKNQCEVSIYLGMATYNGDLHTIRKDANLSLVPLMKMAFGCSYAYNFSDHFSMSINYLSTQLSGDDELSDDQAKRERAISFTNRIHELSIRTDFEPFRFARLRPYFFTGLGVALGEAQNVFGNNNFTAEFKERIALDQQRKTNASFALPAGLGLRYHLPNNISIKLEGSVRLAMNDYLDGISAAGNANTLDSYTVATLGFVYGFGTPYAYKIKCFRPI